MRYLTCLLVILSLGACKKQVTEIEPDLSNSLNASKYLVGIPRTNMAVDDAITIRFQRATVQGHSPNTKGIRITPSVPGIWKWADDQTLQLRPDQPLQYNTRYELSIDMGILLENDNPDIVKTSFRTGPLRLAMLIDQPEMILDDNQVNIKLRGQVKSTDYIKNDEVEKMVSATLSDSKMNLSWTHRNNRVHEFEVLDMPVNKDPKTIMLKWDGRSFDKTFAGTETIAIEAADELSLVDVDVVEDEANQIKVVFSQPLDPGQNYNGLVTIQGAKDYPRISIKGNIMNVYPSENIEGDFTIVINQKTKSWAGVNLDKTYTMDMSIKPAKPDLRTVGGGVITPSDETSIFAFEAINLDTVDVEIYKIYADNMLQFLQDNNLSESYSLEQVGRIEYQAKVPLSTIIKADGRRHWKLYHLDLTGLLNRDINAVYKVNIGYRPTYTSYSCDNTMTGYQAPQAGESIMRYQYNYNDYQYEHNENPCYPAYYQRDRFLQKNVLFSNVGAIVKKGSGNTFHVTTTRINTGAPLSNVKVSFYDYQQQLLSSALTSLSGLARMEVDHEAAFAVFEHIEGAGYVRLFDGEALSVSDFDTGGKLRQSGIDGYIYHDRGVYRPGDTIYMHFMMTSTDRVLPDDHPVTLKVTDARGKQVSAQTTTSHLDRIYTFKIATEDDDPTGYWQATINVGSVEFLEPLRVETIKPNRLRVAIEAPELIQYANTSNRTLDVASSWLHGAPAKGLRAVVEADWSNYTPRFRNYSDYTFVDPARKLPSSDMIIYDDKLDANGRASIKLELDKNDIYPTMLKANLTTRVFENGGDFSENYSSISVSPYSHYVGLSVPKNDWGYASVKIGDNANIESVVTDEKGQPASGRNLTVGVYDINWQWWYYSGQRWRIYELNSAEHKSAVYTTTAKTNNEGVATVTIPTTDFEYGRKMIRICDTASGHCTGDFFYASGWRSSISEEERNSLSKLTFSLDKPNYKVGDNVSLNIPSQEDSRILVSIEDDKSVIVQEWIEGSAGSTTYQFGLNASMAPNVYAHVMLVQPQASANNDLPLRMYGVMPILVSNPATELSPVITTTDEYEPEKEFTINISEEDGKAMNYTVAIVDEGLLDLTNYKTPDPHSEFYAKRSLGVKTWDMYDYVAYGKEGAPDRIIAIGGDGEFADGGDSKKALRFKPVVFSAGPFTLSKGQKKSHTFTMPNYIGSVRAMVVAKKGTSFGHTDVSVPVKTPLMVLPTIPRVLSPGENVTIPASVFVMEPGIKNVAASITTNELIKINDGNDALNFKEVGEQMSYFDITVGDRLGIGKIDVSARSGSYKTSQQVELNIRNPMPPKTEVINYIIPAGETWNTSYASPGMQGSNNGIVELSQLPNLNLEDRMGGLIRYPYGCIEQTTSAVFPQLYLADLSDYISADQIDENIKAGIKRISKMERGGGFLYWPGSRSGADSWGTSYAGHFLIEAMDKGYFVSQSMMRRWAQYQEQQAKSWRSNKSDSPYTQHHQYIDQAYRLYTLSLNSTPALPAMNLLRMEADLPATAKYLLAAAYALSSKQEVALDLIKDADPEVTPYTSRGGTYGSDLRDMALIAQTMTALDRKTAAADIIRKIALRLKDKDWYSTQTTAHALLSIGKYVKENGSGDINAKLEIGNQAPANVNYKKSIFTMAFDPDKQSSSALSITNSSSTPLFASVQLTGQPSPQSVLTSQPYSNNVSVTVDYTNLDGSAIDVSSIEQGKDFIANVKVKNLNTMGPQIEGMALTQILPSGWEIRSGRLNEVGNITESAYEHRDVRDDRVHTFFDLRGTQTYAILLNATYEGTFFLPPVNVEAMYDKSISATTKGKMVRVVRRGN